MLQRAWNRLTEPPYEIQSAEQRRRVRLLLSLLAVIIPLGLGSGIVQLLLVPEFFASFVLISFGVGALILAYVLARGPHFAVGALITCLVPSIASLAILAVNPADNAAFAYLLVGVMLGSMLSNIPTTAWLAAGNVVAIAALPAVNPAWTTADLAGPLSFNVVIPALLLIFMRHRDLLELDRQRELLERDRQVRALNERLDEKVRERTAQLSDVNRELEAFAYSVSHDLRAPLRVISGYARILAEDFGASMSRDAKQTLDRVSRAAVRMGELIEDLLRLSRLGRRALRITDVRPEEVVRRAISELSAEIAGRDVDFVVLDMPGCRADADLLRYVYVNLLGNAIKFTRRQPKARIEIGCRSVDGEAAYYVSDDGVGFDMQYADKLFGVFQRLHSSSEYEGTGAGLSIVKRIVTMHGGRVWAQGAPQQGATFFFTLEGKRPT